LSSLEASLQSTATKPTKGYKRSSYVEIFVKSRVSAFKLKSFQPACAAEPGFELETSDRQSSRSDQVDNGRN